MKTNIIYKLLLPVLGVFVLSSCSEEWMDVNTDPNNPSEATLNLLLPGAQAAKVFSMTRDMNKNTMVFSRMVYDLQESQYLQDATTYSNDYDGLFYNSLKEMQEIIDLGTADGSWHYVGVAKIMKAHTYGLMVDLWGDLPYSEALQGDAFLTPVFDDDANIYSQLIALLDEGIADLEKESTLALENDLIYSNNVSRWITAANTIKLKMLINIRKVDAATATAGINALIADGDLIDATNENYSFRFGSGDSPLNRHPLYQIEYAGAGDKDYYMSNYFMYNMIIKNDPRLPYYIYRQASNADLTFETTPCNTRTDCIYWPLLVGLGDVADGYIGRDHGDPSGIPGDNELRATFGVYPIGGSYDDDARQERTIGDGAQGAGILEYVTSSMRAFMLAEAKLTLPGVTGGKTAVEYLEEGIRASMDAVESFSMGVQGSGAVPMADSLVDAYVADRIADFNAATDNNLKLNVVIKEKFYAQFGNGMETFTDVRRTEFPGDLPRSLAPLAAFPLRLPYSSTEIGSNPNTPDVTQSEPVFWDVN